MNFNIKRVSFKCSKLELFGKDRQYETKKPLQLITGAMLSDMYCINGSNLRANIIFGS